MASQRKAAAGELSKKTRLESELRSSLRGLFGAIVRDYRAGLQRGFVPLVGARAGRSLANLLVAHYQKVSLAFMHATSDRLPARLRMSDEEKAELENRLQDVMQARARQQTGHINATTQRVLNRAKAHAAEALRASGGEPEPSEVEALAVSRVAVHLAARANVIACYETQWAAETAKFLEIETLAGATGAVTVKARGELGKLEKEWVSQGDSRVRTGPSSKFDHLAADGQRVPVDQPFDVSGEMLFWPGDTARGASLGNVINCRCSAIYNVDSVAELRELIGQRARPDASAFDFKPTESTVVVGRDLGLPASPPPAPAAPAPPPAPAAPAPSFIENAEEAIARAKSEFEREVGLPSGRPDDAYLARLRAKLKQLNAPSESGIADEIAVRYTPKGDLARTVPFKEIADADVRDAYHAFKEITDGLVHEGMRDVEKLKSLKIIIDDAVRRAFAVLEENRIVMNSANSRRQIAHEVGHIVENTNPKAQARLAKWRDDRIGKALLGGESPVEYGNELMFRDGFFDSYVGKMYADANVTEVLSMAMEGLYDGNRLAMMLQNDPEHFHILWATLRGY